MDRIMKKQTKYILTLMDVETESVVKKLKYIDKDKAYKDYYKYMNKYVVAMKEV